MTIYHLALRDEWDEAADAGEYRRSTLGVSLKEQGFVHCSFADQVQGIADLVYAGRDDVVVLTIDEARLGDGVDVKVEGGYPHIYGPLPIGAVTDVRPLRQ